MHATLCITDGQMKDYMSSSHLGLIWAARYHPHPPACMQNALHTVLRTLQGPW
jgi:hypothetical protein